MASGWDESDHPRDSDGRFTDGWAQRISGQIDARIGRDSPGDDWLDIADRLELEEGERFVRSEFLGEGDDGSVSLVQVDTPYGPEYRLGFTADGDDDEWTGGGDDGVTAAFGRGVFSGMARRLQALVDAAQAEAARLHGLYDIRDRENTVETRRLMRRKSELSRLQVEYDAGGMPLPGLRPLPPGEAQEWEDLHMRLGELSSNPYGGLPDLDQQVGEELFEGARYADLKVSAWVADSPQVVGRWCSRSYRGMGLLGRLSSSARTICKA